MRKLSCKLKAQNMKNIFILMMLALSLFSACTEKQHLPLVDEADFKTTIDNKPVDLYTLCNDNGLTMQVTNFGCRVVTFLLPIGREKWKI